MKSPPWLTPWRVACVIAGGALGCSALAQPPSIRTPASAAAAVRAATGVRPTMAQALDAAWMAASEELYAAGQQPGADAGAQNAGNAGGAEDVQDADFEEVK